MLKDTLVFFFALFFPLSSISRASIPSIVSIQHEQVVMAVLWFRALSGRLIEKALLVYLPQLQSIQRRYKVFLRLSERTEEEKKKEMEGGEEE